MKNDLNKLQEAQQAGDCLLIKLLTNQQINEDFVGTYSPPDVPDECEGLRTVIRREGPRLVPRKWNKRELRLKALHPGMLLSYDAREAVKYRWPPAPAMLREFINSVLDTAWSHWSRAIEQGTNKKIFIKWLPEYLIDEPWHDREGWAEAAQVLRLNLGLPRFRPTGAGGGNV